METSDTSPIEDPKEYDYDSAIAIIEKALSTPMPSVIKHVLGAENIERLIAVFNSEYIKGIDALLASGELSEREVGQYLTALPELQEIRRELLAIGDEMMRTIQEKLAYKIKRSVDRRGNFTNGKLRDVFICLDDLVKYLSINEFANTMGAKLTELRFYVLERVVFESLKIAEKRHSDRVRSQMFDFFSNLECLSIKDEKCFFYQRAANIFAIQSSSTHFIGQNFQYETARIDSKLPSTDLEEDELKKANNELLEKIRDLSLFRKIKASTFKTPENLKIEILDESESKIDEITRFSVICCFVITFSTGERFVLNIDRSIGNIRYNSSSIDGERFLPPQIIERLKNTVFTYLVQQLLEQEDEIEQYLDPRRQKKSPPEIQTETNEELSETITYQYKPYAPDPTAPTAPETIEETEENRVDLSKFSGLSAREVKSKIEDFLGEPLRIRGSHHIYEGVNGCRFPIPFHSGKDVNQGLLIKCLKQWGILGRFYRSLN